MFDPNIAVPTQSAKAPALAETASQHVPTLSETAGSIFEGLQAIAANPGLPLEEIGIGIGAIASVAATMRAIQEFRKDRGEDRLKREAIRASSQWAAADGSLIAYATNRGQTYEAALTSATAEINRFIPRSDARAQALDIAMRMPKEERLDSAGGFDKALADFTKAMPRDAGVAQNHAKLAQLASTPLEAAAAAERAAFGAIERGDAITAKARQSCFGLLQATACRAVAAERGELVQEVIVPARASRRGLRRSSSETR